MAEFDDHEVRLRSTAAHQESDDLRESSIGELLKRLADDAAALVRQEIALAKVEMSEKGKEVGKGAGMLGAAGVIALLAAGTLTAFLVLALGEVMPHWLAALLVGLVYLAVAGFLAMKGKKQVQTASPPVPEQTIETVKEDVEWLKNRK